MNRAFSAYMGLGAYEPRALPWAGMKDAVGVSQPKIENRGTHKLQGWLKDTVPSINQSDDYQHPTECKTSIFDSGQLFHFQT